MESQRETDTDSAQDDARREVSPERDPASTRNYDDRDPRHGLHVRRVLDVEATPEEVWEALVTEDGRERWLEQEEHAREIRIESAEEPHRLVWWWTAPESPDGPATRVAFEIVAIPAGARVVVTESAPAHVHVNVHAPTFPIARLQASFAALVAA